MSYSAAFRAPLAVSARLSVATALVLVAIALVPHSGTAQRTMRPGGGMRPEPPRGAPVEPAPIPPVIGDTTTPEGAARAAQRRFEVIRRNNLPNAHSSRPSNCDEQVGRWCYWYDEKAPKSIELAVVSVARDTLNRQLDSLGQLVPSNRWIAGQRVRYLAEAGRYDSALAAAQQCRADGWWCPALVAFAQHLRGNYVAADSGFRVVQGAMGERERCQWRDISLLIDDDTRQPYRRMPCGAEREAFEDRVWWYSRTLYGMRGNDSRTEWNARRLMVRLYQDAPGAHQFGFDDDERELLLRFGWPRYWAKGPGDPRAGGFSIVSDEASPAYRYIPAGNVLSNPALSDSSHWRLHRPPVIGRYAPPYAKSLVALEHQQAMFRRGDSALLVMAYDVSNVPGLRNGAARRAALVVAQGDNPSPHMTARARAAATDTMSVRGAWGPLLFSGEVWAPDSSVVARARYGVHPPYAVDTRVTVSDLLFYKPSGTLPTTVEEALAHALPTERVRSSAPLGVYWET
ncbi:MAG: hypothetical protein HYV19_04150, partial [Gemmatimonadetes bacterium]|nr:hypothetical protein [Gemmatimonadota bacterium]